MLRKLSLRRTDRLATLNTILRKIDNRKTFLMNEHMKMLKTKFSLQHRVANDQVLSLYYINAEKELDRLYSITYSLSGRVQINRNVV